jgi:hypothetical protein
MASDQETNSSGSASRRAPIAQDIVEHVTSFVGDRRTFSALAVMAKESHRRSYSNHNNVPWPRKRLPSSLPRVVNEQDVVSFASPDGQYLAVVQLRPLYDPTEEGQPPMAHQEETNSPEEKPFIEIWNARRGLIGSISSKELLAQAEPAKEGVENPAVSSSYLSLGMTRRQVASRLTLSNKLLAIHIPSLNTIKIWNLTSSGKCESAKSVPLPSPPFMASPDSKIISAQNNTDYFYYQPDLIIHIPTGQIQSINLFKTLQNTDHIHTVRLTDQNEMIVVHSKSISDGGVMDPTSSSSQKMLNISKLPIQDLIHGVLSNMKTASFAPSSSQGFGNRSGTLSPCGRYYAVITTVQRFSVVENIRKSVFTEAIQVYDTCFQDKPPILLELEESVPFITQVNLTSSQNQQQHPKVSAILHGRGIDSPRFYQEWNLRTLECTTKVLPIPSRGLQTSSRIMALPRIERHVVVMDTDSGVELYPIATLKHAAANS